MRLCGLSKSKGNQLSVWLPFLFCNKLWNIVDHIYFVAHTFSHFVHIPGFLFQNLLLHLNFHKMLSQAFSILDFNSSVRHKRKKGFKILFPFRSHSTVISWHYENAPDSLNTLNCLSKRNYQKSSYNSLKLRNILIFYSIYIIYLYTLYLFRTLWLKRADRWHIIHRSNGTLKRLSLWKSALTTLPSWDSTAQVSAPLLSRSSLRV